jgi:creatinine amidohydrolase
MFWNWTELTSNDFKAIDPARAVALMPVAAIEQHGPHLPVSVDSDINAGIVAACAGAGADTPVYVLPQLPIGKSNEHGAFPGTLVIGAETLMHMWLDVAESVIRAGFRKLVILNSHGGQPQIVDIVVRELRVRHAVLAVSANTYGLGLPAGLFDKEELTHGIHGGAVETSIMMHLHPERVRMKALSDFASTGPCLEQQYALLRLEGPIGLGWMTQDINPAGAVGDASAATAEHGLQCVETAARGLAALLDDVSRYPMDLPPFKPQEAS